MKKPDSCFLEGENLQKAIIKIVKQRDLRCAVAFWGIGATKFLFENNLPQDARLICDVSLGSTNPAELKNLGAPNNKNLRHMWRLHAKVYISEQGLIIGSANASDAGVGFDGSANLIEVGVFHASETLVYKKVVKWFEKIWEESDVVNDKVLEEALNRWRPRASKILLKNEAESSLIGHVLKNIGKFQNISFVFSSMASCESDRDEAASAFININDVDSETVTKIEEWSIDDVFSGWEPDNINNWSKIFVRAYKRKSGKVSYFFYERCFSVVHDQSNAVFSTLKNGELRKQMGFKHGISRMEQEDQARLIKVFDKTNEGSGLFFSNGERLAVFLEENNI